jgi:Malectin domain
MCESEGSRLSNSEAQAVRAELNRLLESAAFRNSKRCREFLEYIVEHTINGPGGALKERSIGVELFQLPQDFDTGQHTIVRVTANEVRKKLAQNYLAENGSYHPVKIHVPLGSYSAEFKWEAPPPTAEAPAPMRARWLSGAVIACSTAALVIAGALLLWRSHAVKPITVDAKSPSLPSAANVSSVNGDLRMIAGSTESYLDRNGRIWGPDQFFSAGNVLVRPSEKIFRTLDPDIYRHLRSGDFRYDIPLAPGNYELHLHFAETGLADFISAESSGEGQRLFRVSANGDRILPAFDVVADAAGANVADERVFRNISPAEDGFLHLSFNAMRSTAMLNAIELLPVSAGKVRPVRIRAGWTTSWQDPAGQPWQADTYFLGGNALVRTTNPAQGANSIAPDMALYGSERWGHFSYALPVPEGRYRVKLKFCEGHYGKRNTGVGGLGGRLFDVYCNGVALLRNFDIFKEAGGEGRPLDKAFPGIRPNAQGKIILTFVPVAGMACVNGIEVVED